MNMVPEFSTLMQRAIEDFSRQLDGFRLHNRWNAAHEAVMWLTELAKTSPATTPPGHLLPEHILDSQLPIWRVWTYWKPDVNRLKRLAGCSSEQLAVVSDFIALEGPDMVTGAASTAREGLITEYNGAKALLKWRGIIVEVPDRTKTQLKTTLIRVVDLLDRAIDPSGPGYESRFQLFRDIIIARPINASTLDLFEAVCRVQWTAKHDIYNAIREIYGSKDVLGGQHILALQNLLGALDDAHSADLKDIFLEKWLRTGIETCREECREAVHTHIIKGLPWTKLAIEYHDFCMALKASEHHWPSELQTIKIPSSWPSPDDIRTVVQIYEAAQDHRQKQRLLDHPNSVPSQQEGKPRECAEKSKHAEHLMTMLTEKTKNRSILEEVSEAYCMDHLLGGPTINYSHQRIVQNIMLVWKQTSKPTIDEDRRELAILVSENAGSDFILRCRYLAEIAFGKAILEPGTSATELLIIVRKSENELPQAIIDLTNLISSKKAWTSCWKDLLYLWFERQNDTINYIGPNILDYSLQVMSAAQWLSFISNIERLFADLTLAASPKKTIPSILQPALLEWRRWISTYGETFQRLETSLGERCVAVQCLLNLKNCILYLVVATPQGIETCDRIWDAKHGQLDIPGLPPKTQQSITRWTIASFATFIGICVENVSDSKWNSKIAEATTFWRKIEDEITTEALRLEGIQQALKAKDPKGTAILLQELGFADSSLLDDEIACLPPSIANMVEEVAHNEVEISFPLNSLTDLQRGAMGIPEGATTLLLRLSLDANTGSSPAFCMHFNNEPNLDSLEHVPWICSPDSTPLPEQFCTKQQTAFTWQLSGIVHMWLKIHNGCIVPLYKFITGRIQNMGQVCVTCGTSHNARHTQLQLRRATPCNIMACARLWYQLPLHVRIPEIRTDTYAVDMLLTSVYAAAMSG
ncbi:hypothetical protein IQ06DRAFT_196078, partial [Phaeosphaeriaceae sp. SRC1lsM3a]